MRLSVKGKAHEVYQRHQVPQEIRGSEVESLPCSFRPSTNEILDRKPPSPLSSRLPRLPRFTVGCAVEAADLPVAS